MSGWPPSGAEVKDRLENVAALYPGAEADVQRHDIRRIAFAVRLITETTPRACAIADIGGGLGLLSPALADIGYKQTLVDDFRDPGNVGIAQHVFECVHSKVGVNIVTRDVIRDGLDLPPASQDTVTSFDSIEHWHHSPKPVLKAMMTALRPSGVMILGVPNCVNLRKRITVPFGYGKWSQMVDWYEQPVFRGHVREPDVGDLRYIANDIGLTDTRIIGRNWTGYDSRWSSVRRLTPMIDRALQPFPSLCADLYLIGRKPMQSLRGQAQ